MISDVEIVLNASNGGLNWFEQNIDGFSTKKHFKIREENTPSAKAKEHIGSGRWRVSDFGDETGMDVFHYVQKMHNLDFRGAIEKIASDLNIYLPSKKQNSVKVYDRPNPKAHAATQDDLIAYFATRQISKNTIEKYGVYMGREKSKNTGNFFTTMVFPYTKDGELVNHKQRFKVKDKKAFLQDDNAEHVLFGLDHAAGKKAWVWVEGEVDTLSIYEALDKGQGGKDNYLSSFGKELSLDLLEGMGVVSVPNGSNDPLHCITNCIDWVENVDTHIIFTDNDKAGEKLRLALTQRLPQHKIKVVNRYFDCNDANEILVKKGHNYVLNAILEAEKLPIEDIFDPTDYWEDAVGFIEGTKTFTQKLGWQIDRVYRVANEGSLLTLTGTPGSGKSAFALQIASKVIMKLGWSVMIYSPEEAKSIKLARTTATMSGNPYIKTDEYGKTKDIYRDYFKREAHEAFLPIISESMSWYAPEGNAFIDDLEAKIIECFLRKGVKLVIIDPFTHVEANESSRHETVRILLKMLNNLKNKYGINFIVVAHPTKVQKFFNKDLEQEVIKPVTAYDIAESSHFANASDFILSLYRQDHKGTTEIRCEKVKNQDIEGVTGRNFELRFCVDTNRFYGMGDNNNEYLLPIEKATLETKISMPIPHDHKEQVDGWATRRFEPSNDMFDGSEYDIQPPSEQTPF